MLTAYTVRMAQLLDPHCDLLLVGDSLGQVIYGLPSTLPVTLDMMARTARRWCAAAIMRWSSSTCRSAATRHRPNRRSRAPRACSTETGAAAVKLEGGAAMAPTVAFLTERGIPVMGACRADAAGGQRARRLWRARAQRRRKRRRSSPTRRRSPRPARSRWWSRAWSSRSRVAITETGRLPDDRHRRVGAVRRAGAGRRGHAGPVRAHAALREALRRHGRRAFRDAAATLCRRGAVARVSGRRTGLSRPRPDRASVSRPRAAKDRAPFPSPSEPTPWPLTPQNR